MASWCGPAYCSADTHWAVTVNDLQDLPRLTAVEQDNIDSLGLAEQNLLLWSNFAQPALSCLMCASTPSSWSCKEF